MRMLTVLGLGLTLVLSGCFLRIAPPSSPLTRDEAVARGMQFCRERGYQCQLRKVKRDDNRWRVDLDAQAPDARGKVKLEFDARTHELTKVKEQLKARKFKDKDKDKKKHEKKRGDDDDDD